MTVLPAPPASMTSEALGVAVCAEERSLRDRLGVALAVSGHTVVARSATLEGLLDTCEGRAPACVVIASDRLDGCAGKATRTIRSRLREASVVLVCRVVRGAEVRRTLELGVDGIVLDDDVERALGSVVAAVRAGQISVPGAQGPEVRARPLTTREKQMLALVIAGMTNAEIAAQLFLAESTVKSHLSSAFRKLGVSSRFEAATLALDPERADWFGLREIRSLAPAPWSVGTPNR